MFPYFFGNNGGLSLLPHGWADRLKNAVVPFLFSNKRHMLIKTFIQKLFKKKQGQKALEISKSIMLVGDDDFCVFLKQILGRTDYNVSQVASQDIAGALKERCPNLVIISAKLNGKSSLNICSELRKGDCVKPLPILIITRQNDGSNIMEFFAEKVDACLMEPFSRKKLLEQIRALIA